MRVKVMHYAGESDVFHKDAFSAIIDKTIPFKIPGGVSTPALVKKARVVNLGSAVELTLEIDDKHRDEIANLIVAQNMASTLPA